LGLEHSFPGCSKGRSHLILATLLRRITVSSLNLHIFLLRLHLPHITVICNTTLCYSCETLPFHQGNVLLETENRGLLQSRSAAWQDFYLAGLSAKCTAWLWESVSGCCVVSVDIASPLQISPCGRSMRSALAHTPSVWERLQEKINRSLSLVRNVLWYGTGHTKKYEALFLSGGNGSFLVSTGLFLGGHLSVGTSVTLA